MELARKSEENFRPPSVFEQTVVSKYLSDHFKVLRDSYSYPDPEMHFEKLFLLAVRDVNMQSTPGLCSLNRYGSSNKQVLGMDDDGNFDPIKLAIVKDTVKRRFFKIVTGEGSDTDSDLIKLFIKVEAIKTAKVESNRFRIISSISLVDQIVDRILFMLFARNFRENRLKTGCMVGYSPTKGGWVAFNHLIPQDTYKLMIDKTAFDWTVKPWMTDVAKELLHSLNPFAKSWWHDAVDRRFEALFGQPTFSFSDTTTIQQPFRGVMKSGCYLTIILNSILQLAIHRLTMLRARLDVSDDFILVMGDDTLQLDFEESDEYVDAMKTTGVLPKVTVSEISHFAGFKYYPDGFVPEYREKHAFFFSHIQGMDLDILGATLTNYLFLYYYDEEMKKFIRSVMEFYHLSMCDVDEKYLMAFQLGQVD